MESGDIAKVLLGVVAFFVLVGKSVHYLITALVTSQVDRLIEAHSVNNENANERHAGMQRSLKKVAKSLRRLKRKKCSGKSSPVGPPGHPEDHKRGKTLAKKASSKN